MDFNFTDERLNAQLYLVMEGYIDIDNENDYKYNKDLVLHFFKRFPDAMLSYLSMATFNYVKDNLKEDYVDNLDQRFFLNEDFRLLVILGIIDNETLKFNPLYHEVIAKSLNFFTNVDEIVTFQCVLKGLIDVYGYIEMKHLNQLMHLYMPDSKEQLLELDLFLTRAGLIFPYVETTDDYVCRKELTPVLHDFCKVRENITMLNYKIYSIPDLIKFACSFTFEGRTNLDIDNPFNQLLNQKYLLYYISPLLAVHQLGYDVPEGDNLKILYEFNIEYPKWLLKGHSVISMREEEGKEEL